MTTIIYIEGEGKDLTFNSIDEIFKHIRKNTKYMKEHKNENTLNLFYENKALSDEILDKYKNNNNIFNKLINALL